MKKQWAYSKIVVLSNLKPWNSNHNFCLFGIIQNLENKGIIIVIKKLCGYNL